MLFLARINEALPVWRFFQLAPSQTIGGYLYAVFALAMCAFAPPGRARNCVMAFAATALAVATLQYRGVSFAILFALPGLAAALLEEVPEPPPPPPPNPHTASRAPFPPQPPH